MWRNFVTLYFLFVIGVGNSTLLFSSLKSFSTVRIWKDVKKITNKMTFNYLLGYTSINKKLHLYMQCYSKNIFFISKSGLRECDRKNLTKIFKSPIKEFFFVRYYRRNYNLRNTWAFLRWSAIVTPIRTNRQSIIQMRISFLSKKGK